ncbi:MAG: radical SAM family heme chaperone HemW [Cyclobacteriaceae bacterium]|nr:MAG: radical SAM family heme chaperone HemW [Cyclobacteriaceae bacterium]
MAGIYIHIPFCKQACYYCDFHFSTNQTLRAEMVMAIAREIGIQKDYLGHELVNTIYFGGGTPSVLSPDEIHRLLQTINELHPVAPDAEITLEANPDDLHGDYLRAIRQAGVNRLSIGIQTFHDDLLRYMNRAHDRTIALKTFEAARHAGFANISLDLIYSIPGQDDNRWKADIEQALLLEPQHISCYSLTIEPQTVFGKWATTGKLRTIPDDLAANQFEILMDRLQLAGYEHYEISNFALPGFYSRHNSSYWRQENYLGVGPSAHSFNQVSRQFNVRNNHHYLKGITQGTIPAEKEILTIENKINEFILTTLRTQWGTDLTTLKHKYGYDLAEQNSAYLQELMQQKLIVVENEVITLTRSGKLLADKIASDLFIVSS